MLEVAAAASRAGHSVDFVPYNEKKLSLGYWHTALLIDGQLCYIQTVTNAQSRPHRKQVYAHTGVHWAALDKYAVMIFFVAVPGYEQMTLVVPTAGHAEGANLRVHEGRPDIALHPTCLSPEPSGA